MPNFVCRNQGFRLLRSPTVRLVGVCWVVCFDHRSDSLHRVLTGEQGAERISSSKNRSGHRGVHFVTHVGARTGVQLAHIIEKPSTGTPQ
jgi:hypothetical protein